MFLADPVLATVPETYLEQSIVLWDCCCVNDPWDVLKVLWNKKLKEVSSLWQKLQGRKCLDDRKSSCKFDWGLAVRFSPRLPLFCSSSPTFFMVTEGGETVLEVNSLQQWRLLPPCYSFCFLNAAYYFIFSVTLPLRSFWTLFYFWVRLR